MSPSLSLQDAIQVLRSGCWFAALPVAIQKAMTEAGTLRTLKSGQTLFAQGSDPSGLHAVIIGELHVTGTSVSGNDVIMAIIRPSDWTGFLACLDHGPHAYSATAVTEAVVFSLRPSVVSAIFETDVTTYRMLMASELMAARKLGNFVIEDMGLPLAQRVAARLADLGRWAYGPASGPVAELDHVSQEELAMSVHASRQKVNMILRDLADRRIIEIGYGRIRVIDPVALDHFAHVK